MTELRRRLSLSAGIWLRVAADVLLINLALLTAVIVRYVSVTMSEPAGATPQLAARYASYYATSVPALTMLAVLVSWSMGLYTTVRTYRPRQKALVVMRAVTLTFLLFGFAMYFTGGSYYVPRGALAGAWALTLVSQLVARLWARTWLQVSSDGGAATPIEDRAIRCVLVIGGGGYIGSALVRQLLERGYMVRVLDILLYGDGALRPLMGNRHLEVMKGDFRQVDQVVSAMHGVDAVVHLGAIVGDPACALDESLTIDVNIMATRMIAEVAKGARVNRFVFASTCSVYGVSDEVLDESSPLNPVSLYACSKIACERVLMEMADEHFAPVILRFGTIYGLSGRTRFDLVVNVLAAKAVIDGKIPVHGGSQWRPFVHVDDAARGILMTLEGRLDVLRGRSLNVGSDEQNYTIAEVASRIAKLVPSARIMEGGSGADRRNYRVSCRAFHDAVGFVPHWSLEAGIRQVIGAINEGRVSDYRDALYSNEKYLLERGLLHLPRRRDDWARELIDAREHAVGV